MKENQGATKNTVIGKKLTDAELIVLGLVAEMPRHGYELERVIAQRGMREWTQIGFSSIYFVLGKLEKKNLVGAKKPIGTKTRKIYTISETGRQNLVKQTLLALEQLQPNYASVLLGMAHWPVLETGIAVAALRARGQAAANEMARLENIQFEQQPLPDFVEAMFDFSLSQLKAEADWAKRTADYMEIRPE